VRGWTDLVVNGSFWIGAALGAFGAIVLLDPIVINPEFGWRLCFGIGAVLALVIFFMRLWLPESPRWLMTHGHVEEAECVVLGIEQRVFGGISVRTTEELPRVRLLAREHTPLSEVMHTLIHRHRRRTLVGLALMVAQAFFYNAIFFTYALVLTDFYSIAASQVGWYILPFAAGNFLGPLLLGRLFDVIGRRPMIALTYIVSGVLLTFSGYLFEQGTLNAAQQTLAWTIIFFFASAAASSAYLTVSETFPLEIRALAIAVFYAVGTGIGGMAGPWLFGALIDTGSRTSLFGGYLLGAALMIAAGLIAAFFAVAAERKSLEQVARPLAFVD
jgi:MFS family permease